MTISETDFAYRIDRWDTYGGNIFTTSPTSMT